ncbi:alanine racemase [Clostridium botulinum]|uniref:Alanine racemase n=1 Tax=Clostridium botulinum (strain Hall / ATCC 3502 / NCTC 13319 / Type A) TaxID=441771 RepID=A5I7C2_CLOBH|nr:alanine racemase [Clostridium botulinum]ABS35309.1 alanine racemase [Clostridium botulinum A str. ATCC 19397]ABS36480.1 alanine racemase [Clostridium botulinum A str. Hall]APQ74016.1 alanine racemase [Clostridium botulinum]APQ97706.1 alanine racemase [Clostridium botulinum]AUM89419.1 alanine racemase [Clostridium botulinum]
MFRNLRAVWAEIDLDNLQHNLKQIKKICGNKEIIGVIKANAYGHGAMEIAPTLLENGVSRLAVAVLSEAMELRMSGVKEPIMILGYTPWALGDMLLDNDIEQSVYSYNDALELSKIAVLKRKILKIHIVVDTGMGRIGFLPTKESVEDVYKISKLPNIEIEGIFSHFSSADESDKDYTLYQMNKYNAFINKLEEKNIQVPIKHIANSAAIIDLENTHLDAVRAGIIMYGYYPSNYVLRNNINLKPVMSLKTSIVHIKKVSSGEYISYGRTFKTKRESIIATLPIGYADGYNRLLSNKGKVIVNGKLAPVIGRVCMDQCMIDVTFIENLKVGDVVTIMGEENGVSYTAEDIASQIGTISYEVICNVNKRVPRVYKKDGKIINVVNYI